MAIFVRLRVSVGCVLKLEVVRLGELDAPAGEQVGVLFLVCQTAEEVDVVLAEVTVIHESVLDEGVRIVA